MIKKKHSLQRKLELAFAVMIVGIIVVTLLLHVKTVSVIRKITYEKMDSQAEYYQQTFETELQGIWNLQIEFFNNHSLPFLASPSVELGAYEEREAVFNVQERIQTITEVSDLLREGILYLPRNQYYISNSHIRRMTQADYEDMKRYLSDGEKMFGYDGENFYCVRTGEKGKTDIENPAYVFLLIFSSRVVEEKLSVLNSFERGGTFIYNEEEKVMLESSASGGMGEKIRERLETDESGAYVNIQRVRADGKEYLVLAGGIGIMGSFVQYVEEASITGYITRSWVYVTICLLAVSVMAVVFVRYTRRIVQRPLSQMVKAFEKVKGGNLSEHIYHGADDEFSYLYQEFNEMEDKLRQLIEEVYIQKNLTQEAQLKQLQAQINPHFLYNSFFTLSRRIKRQDYGNAEEFAKHLGNYFQYITRDGADYVPLRQEAEHARSYAAIQQTRFLNRVTVQFDDLPECCGGLQVPRLILQPLLENAFGHGLENKVSGGILHIGFLAEEGILRIVVEDNGEQAGDEDIRTMQEALKSRETDEVTGLVNIHRRLQIYFGKKGEENRAGLRIYRSSLGGVAVDIEIVTPEIKPF